MPREGSLSLARHLPFAQWHRPPTEVLGLGILGDLSDALGLVARLQEMSDVPGIGIRWLLILDISLYLLHVTLLIIELGLRLLPLPWG